MSAVLLDTCALVNLVLGGPMLPGALAAIRQARRASAAFVPSVAATEVAQKVASGKLALGGAPSSRAWFAAVMAVPGLIEVGVSIEAALAAYELPAPFHKDPSDRLIVALSRLLGAPVVTSDGRILGYAALGHVRAIAC